MEKREEIFMSEKEIAGFANNQKYEIFEEKSHRDPLMKEGFCKNAILYKTKDDSGKIRWINSIFFDKPVNISYGEEVIEDEMPDVREIREQEHNNNSGLDLLEYQSGVNLATVFALAGMPENKKTINSFQILKNNILNMQETGYKMVDQATEMLNALETIEKIKDIKEICEVISHKKK